MSMTITRENDQYRVRLSGDRRRFVAKADEELLEAVRHYWGLRKEDNHFDKCPICRVVHADRWRGSNAGVARRRKK